MNRPDAQNSLVGIIGRRLSAVVFVEDYVQFHFEEPTTVLTAITMPTVTTSQHEFGQHASGYRDALCDLIDKRVRAASVIEGAELRLEMEDGAVLTVSLKPEEARGPESATFSRGPGDLWVW
jgi:hypothetical protein